MTYDGYHAKIEYDAELDTFRGEILGLNGGADFYGRNPKELRAEFKRSLHAFLEVCKEKGIEPRRHYSGNLTSESRRSCMNNWRSLHRQKVQASINSLKRHFRKRYEMPANNLMQFAPSAPDATWRVQ